MKSKYIKDNYMAVNYGWTEEDFEFVYDTLFNLKTENNIPATPSEIKGHLFRESNHILKEEKDG